MKVLYYGAFSSLANAATGFFPLRLIGAAVQNPARLELRPNPKKNTWCMEPYVHSRVDSNTFTMGGQPYAIVDFIPQSGTFDFVSVPTRFPPFIPNMD